MNDLAGSTAANPPDEDVLLVPDSWRRVLHPRRDGYRPRSVTKPKPGGLAAERRAEIEATLAEGSTPAELAEPALAHLRGAANPLGAAVVATMTTGYARRDEGTRIVDGWVAEHGLAFAACAFAESAGLARDVDSNWRQVVRHAGRGDAFGSWWADDRGARRLRTLLAVADERDYQEVVARLAELRRTPAQRVAVSYLVPTRLDWVDEYCANGEFAPVWMVLCTLSTPGQLEAFTGSRSALDFWEPSLGVFATLAERLGAAALPYLTALLDKLGPHHVTRSILLDVLSMVPGDEAFRALLERAGNYVGALQRAAARFPARAVRLLAPVAASASPRAKAAADLLDAHVRNHPEVAEAVLPHLPEQARAVVESMRTDVARIPEAPAEDLPPLLVAPPWTRKRKASARSGAAAAADDQAADPLEALPARMPKIPVWADPAGLPQVLLRDRERALPVDATRHLVTMLAVSKPGAWYAGLDVVREACDPGSLAEFSWALCEAWRSAGGPSREQWAFRQLGLFGDDETVRRLSPLIRKWPGLGRHARAVAGLDVLAEIGTDLALIHLNGIAQKVKYKALQAQAERKIQEIAARLRLTPERLADRLVPDFGLDADGGMVLDYGPRRFTVGFDEALKPYVLDESGKRRASLPKPGAKDDPELAPAAYQRFAALRKDVRTVAADQIRRLESAMVNRRRWTVREFEEYLVRHPFMWHITRRLVWLAEVDAGTGEGTGTGAGTRTVAFRIAEDRTFADVADDAFTPPPSARVGVAHPVDLGDDLAAWSELFADYEILQPFRQLARPVYALTEEERRTGRLARFEGVWVPTGQVIGLERHGWRRAAPEIADLQFRISRQVTAEYQVVIHLEPGIVVGNIDREPEQCLETVFIVPAGRPDDDDPEKIRVEMDPVAASELLATLTSLTGTG